MAQSVARFSQSSLELWPSDACADRCQAAGLVNIVDLVEAAQVHGQRRRRPRQRVDVAYHACIAAVWDETDTATPGEVE